MVKGETVCTWPSFARRQTPVDGHMPTIEGTDIMNTITTVITHKPRSLSLSGAFCILQCATHYLLPTLLADHAEGQTDQHNAPDPWLCFLGANATMAIFTSKTATV